MDLPQVRDEIVHVNQTTEEVILVDTPRIYKTEFLK